MKLLSLALIALLAFSACSKDSNTGINATDDQSKILQAKQIKDIGLKGTKKIALTFDDGPIEFVTEDLLAVLRKHGVKASFFLVGSHIQGNEQAVWDMSQSGHVVANHTYSHAGLSRASLDIQVIIDQLMFAHAAIKPYISPKQKRLYFRAPGGSWNGPRAPELNLNATLKKYIGPINWNVGGELRIDANGKATQAADWDCWGRGLSVQNCAGGYAAEMAAKQGGILLAHDSEETVEMMKILIPLWKKQGYTFVTMDQLPQLQAFQ